MPSRIKCCMEDFRCRVIPEALHCWYQSRWSISGCCRDKTSYHSAKTSFRNNRREHLNNREQMKGRSMLADCARKMYVNEPSGSQEWGRNINIIFLLAKRKKIPRTSYSSPPRPQGAESSPHHLSRKCQPQDPQSSQ